MQPARGCQHSGAPLQSGSLHRPALALSAGHWPPTRGVGPARVEAQLVAIHARDAAVIIGPHDLRSVAGAAAAQSTGSRTVWAVARHAREQASSPSMHPASAQPQPPAPAPVTVLVSTSPLPVQSTASTTFALPSVVVCRPAAPGSTPVSKMATTVPRPSYVGCSCRAWGMHLRVVNGGGVRTGEQVCVRPPVTPHLEERGGLDLLLRHGPPKQVIDQGLVHLLRHLGRHGCPRQVRAGRLRVVAGGRCRPAGGGGGAAAIIGLLYRASESASRTLPIAGAAQASRLP